jgi:hypothetical protein
VEPGGVVAQQVPDDDQDGAAERELEALGYKVTVEPAA